MKNKKLFISLICIFYFCFFIFNFSLASPKSYDGIWFLGFNLGQEAFQDQRVREAVARSIDAETIVSKIMSKEVIPAGVVPPGMIGYDPDLLPYPYDVKLAKLMMKTAGFPVTDERLKKLTLLHTDGVKTIAIAEKIREDLKNIGLKIDLVQVKYQEQEKWVKELTSGKYSLFLLGYKADYETLFREDSAPPSIDGYSLLQPLFAGNGEANFTGYHNPKVDDLLYKTSGLDLALKSERHAKLKEINDLLYQDLPVVVLFYIEKL